MRLGEAGSHAALDAQHLPEGVLVAVRRLEGLWPAGMQLQRRGLSAGRTGLLLEALKSLVSSGPHPWAQVSYSVWQRQDLQLGPAS